MIKNYVIFRTSGRLGNAIFRYFASSLFCIIYKGSRTYDKDITNVIFSDAMFISWMNDILNNNIPELPDANYNFYGFYQHDKIFIKYKNELIEWMTNNKDDQIYTDGNDESNRNYDYNVQSYFVKELLEAPENLTFYDIVIHLRLEDFINNNNIIHPKSIIKIIRKINKSEPICIVLNKPKTELESLYLDYIKKEFDNIVLQSGTVIEDFHIMKNAKILVCSCSTLSWIASYMSDKIETVYFPNKTCVEHESFMIPIENTILYDYIICTKAALEKILLVKNINSSNIETKVNPNNTYSSVDSRGTPIISKIINHLKYIKNGIYIEIGAYDGIEQSNTKFLEDNYSWTGVLIEPSPKVFKELEKNRSKNININKCIVSKSYKNKTIKGSFDNGPMSSVNNIRNLQNINLIDVDVTTMDDILEINKFDTIDFVSIDTGGYELEVLEGFDLQKYKPKYILIEILENIRDKIFSYMLKENYILVENISNYNKMDNPNWDGSHNDYLFKINNANKINSVITKNIDNNFDIVIPLGPNDKNKINLMIEYTKKNILGYRNIYIISYDKNLKVNDCITVDENSFPFNINTIIKYLGKNDRNGWYFQQLLKLYASFSIKGILDNYLILDSDTFFFKPTYFFENNKALYNFGTVEFHHPYFNHMRKLHPSLYKYDMSKTGICHHMIFQKSLVTELFTMVEQFHKKQFYIIFLESVDQNDILGSGCSEYEIYFNYLQIYHKNKITIRELKWTNSRYVDEIQPEDYDYISYHWYM